MNNCIKNLILILVLFYKVKQLSKILRYLLRQKIKNFNLKQNKIQKMQFNWCK